jgi:hypothetical protein
MPSIDSCRPTADVDMKRELGQTTFGLTTVMVALIAGILIGYFIGSNWKPTVGEISSSSSAGGEHNSSIRAEPEKPSRRTYPIEGFRKMVLGKTSESIVGLLGPPDRVAESDGILHFYYMRAVESPHSDKLKGARIEFDDGISTTVTFSDF